MSEALETSEGMKEQDYPQYRVLRKAQFDEDGHEWLTESSPPLLSRDGALRLLAHRQSKGLDHHMEERTGPDDPWHLAQETTEERHLHAMYDALKWLDAPQGTGTARAILAGQLQDYEPYKRYSGDQKESEGDR